MNTRKTRRDTGRPKRSPEKSALLSAKKSPKRSVNDRWMYEEIEEEEVMNTPAKRTRKPKDEPLLPLSFPALPTTPSLKIATSFLILNGLLFWTSITVPDALESYDSFHGSRLASDGFAVQLYTIYCQVIGSFFLIYATLNVFPGHLGILACSVIMALTTAKHFLVDNLNPPPAVIVFTIVNLAASVRAALHPTQSSCDSANRFAFIFYASSAVIFAIDPTKPLLETFPTLKVGTPLHALAVTEIEAITLFCFAICVSIMMRPNLPFFAATFSLFPFLIYKHIQIDGAGPPALVGYVWTALSLWLIKDSVTSSRSTMAKSD